MRSRLLIRFGQILIKVFIADTPQLCARQDGKQLPTDLQRLFDGAVRVIALGDIFRFKRIRKFGIELIGCLLYTSDAADEL